MLSEARTRRALAGLALALLVSVAGQARAASYKIVSQQLDSAGEGFTVLRVWGTPYEMGVAQGQALAEAIVAGVSQIKGLIGATYYAGARTLLQTTVWKPAGVEQELSGIVDGVKAVKPGASLDVLDLKVTNTLGDWAYAFACRSHSAWGAFVKAPTKTLSSRRLDLAISFPASMTAVRHHVLVAREPAGGGVRWLNLAWPGYVTAITAVNEHGTLGALHNYQTAMAMSAGHMPRCVALRYALTTLVEGLPPAKHLDAVFGALSKQSILTGTFLPYFVPEGHGGVLTCAAGMPCSKKRTPQPSYFGGQVLITTNAETSGKSMPSGGDAWHTYYAAGGPKGLADHYASLSSGLLSGAPAIHRMSVDYRAPGQLTVWAEGLLSSGSTPVIKLEFADLFSSAPPPPDAGPLADAGTPADAGPPPMDAPPTDEGAPPVDGGSLVTDGRSVEGGAAVPADGGSRPPADAAPSGDLPRAKDGAAALGGSGGGCAVARPTEDWPIGAPTVALFGLLMLIVVLRRRGCD